MLRIKSQNFAFFNHKPKCYTNENLWFRRAQRYDFLYVLQREKAQLEPIGYTCQIENTNFLELSING